MDQVYDPRQCSRNWLDFEVTRSAIVSSKVQEELQIEGEHKDEVRAWLRLYGATTIIENEIRSRFREDFGFTLPRFDMLAQLERFPDGLVLGEISRRLMVTAGNVTAICEKLIEDGYVSRTPSPSDKRVQIVRMTRAGRAAFRTMATSHSEWLIKIFSGLSPGDLAELTRILKLLRQSAEKIG